MKTLEKNLRITEKQLLEFNNGKEKILVEQLIRFGNSLGGKIEHVLGPFEDYDSKEMLFIVKYQETENNNALNS